MSTPTQNVAVAARCVPAAVHAHGACRLHPPAASSRAPAFGRSATLRPRRAVARRVQAAQGDNEQPWTLMGRVVRPETAFSATDMRTRMIQSTLCQRLGMTPGELDAAMSELLALLPSLDRAVATMRPDMLAGLIADRSALPGKMVTLRVMLPTANIEKIVAQRPMLLLEPQWGALPERHASLLELFPEANVDAMVERSPLLLEEDVDDIVNELTRLGQATDYANGLRLLEHQPDMVTLVMNNRRLSMW
ncbi:unnamed protein product [Pedinophyceae sp. YPF-701]|nr:unnamed protein product [Pedinophyceae sp. YPF-701]